MSTPFFLFVFSFFFPVRVHYAYKVSLKSARYTGLNGRIWIFAQNMRIFSVQNWDIFWTFTNTVERREINIVVEITPSYLISDNLGRWFFKWYSFQGRRVMNLACCPIFLGLSRSTTMETLRSQDSSCEHKHKWQQQQQLHGADVDGRRQNAQNKAKKKGLPSKSCWWALRQNA